MREARAEGQGGMTVFAVEPDAVRAAAKQVEDARGAVPALRWPDSASIGHPGLQHAVGEFSADLKAVWSSRLDELDEIAARLRASADAYEDADADEAVASD